MERLKRKRERKIVRGEREREWRMREKESE